MRRPTPENLQSLESELVQARENLRISKASEEYIRYDISRLKASTDTPASTIQDYENYHERLKELVDANQRQVDQLEALQRKYTGQPAVSTHNQKVVNDSSQDPDIPEASISDPVADLDRQLDQSLAAFDVVLLKEMELIKIQSKEEIKELTDEIEAARQRLEEQGIEIDAPEEQQSDEAPLDQESQEPMEETQAGSQEQPEKEDTMVGDVESSTQTDPTETGTGAGGMSEKEKEQYGSGEDDDIVARQLREAAEKETDPELRKKLWKEYETYKKNK
jgi:hypothetical protein